MTKWLYFDAVGWAQEGHPACGYVTGAMCRFAYGPADPTAAYYLLLQEIEIGFGFTFLVPAHPGSSTFKINAQ